MNEVPKTISARRAVTFNFADAPGQQVFLSGSFNNWQMNKPMKEKNGTGVYSCRLLLEPGEYQYKFVVNGQWRLDSENPCFVPNGFGELNSLLQVEPKKS